MSRRGSGPVDPGTHAGQEAGSSRCIPSRIHRFSHRGGAVLAGAPRYIIGTVIAVSVSVSAAQAVTFGHSRIISSPGQPLHLEIPVTSLTQQEIDSLQARPAPPEAWKSAGMTPPVDLASMRLVLLDGYRPGVKVIQLRSSQAFEQSIVDVLLDVGSVSGQQRYQVSLLAHADTHAVQSATESLRHPRALDGKAAVSAASPEGKSIQVRAGDTMFAIARRNAVEGVTLYQMMIALQRANPQAFIGDNVNLVKAGATLRMPGMEALTALSDREARRIFQQHAQAFARHGQRGSAGDAAAVSTLGVAAQGTVAAGSTEGGSLQSESNVTNSTDRLRLSGALQAGVSAGQGGTALSAAGVHSGAEAINGPGVSLLASSNVIASDAIADKGPLAVSADTHAAGSPVFGSDASSAGTVLQAGSAGVHPDDQAALQKGVDESRTRILELEDNVRHLNEALQKQGHVAAEAALEGARSVSEAFKEVMSIIDPDEESDAAESAAASVTGAAAASGQASADASALSGSSAAIENRAAQSSLSSTPRTEKKVSWFQENMLAVLGSGLALLVLLVVWVLRRAGAAKRDAFESDSPITDSMVRDKLSEIDLDLNSNSTGQRGS